MSLASNWAELEGKLGAAAARQDEGEDLRPLEEVRPRPPATHGKHM